MQDTVTTVIRGNDGINSNTGQLNWALSASQAACFATDWLNNSTSFPGAVQYIALYDQFRIKKVHIRGTPFNRYSKVTTASGAFYVALDGVITQGGLVLTYPEVTSRVAGVSLSTDDPFEVTFIVPQQTAGVFYDTSSLAAVVPGGVLGPPPGGLLIAGDPIGITASSPYMTLEIELTVEWKGRKE